MFSNICPVDQRISEKKSKYVEMARMSDSLFEAEKMSLKSWEMKKKQKLLFGIYFRINLLSNTGILINRLLEKRILCHVLGKIL